MKKFFITVSLITWSLIIYSQSSILLEYNNYLYSETAENYGGYITPFTGSGDTEFINKWRRGDFKFYTSNGINGNSILSFQIDSSGNIGIAHSKSIYAETVENYGGYLIPFTASGDIELVNKWHSGSINFFVSKGINGEKNLAMEILSNGNVGIGTSTTGTHKLAVEGTIGAREIKVEADGWSDFVFNKGYELKDLVEVEKFIEKNNHLPDIPSEKDVLKNGIQIGEMNAKLLQKIEELTLYMIEMNNRVNSLEIENSELKKKIQQLKTIE